MSYISRNPKRVLGGLTTILVAAGVAVGSGATFDSQTANPSNTFTAGTMTQTNDKSGARIYIGSNMKPGDSATGSVTIKNTGSLKGIFTLTQTIDTNANPFTTGVLNLTIKDGTNATPVYDGPIEGLTNKVVGTFVKDEAHTYAFTVTLNRDAKNVDQGKTFGATYTWDEAQTPDVVTQTSATQTPNA